LAWRFSRFRWRRATLNNQQPSLPLLKQQR